MYLQTDYNWDTSESEYSGSDNETDVDSDHEERPARRRRIDYDDVVYDPWEDLLLEQLVQAAVATAAVAPAAIAAGAGVADSDIIYASAGAVVVEASVGAEVVADFPASPLPSPPASPLPSPPAAQSSSVFVPSFSFASPATPPRALTSSPASSLASWPSPTSSPLAGRPFLGRDPPEGHGVVGEIDFSLPCLFFTADQDTAGLSIRRIMCICMKNVRQRRAVCSHTYCDECAAFAVRQKMPCHWCNFAMFEWPFTKLNDIAQLPAVM